MFLMLIHKFTKKKKKKKKKKKTKEKLTIVILQSIGLKNFCL